MIDLARHPELSIFDLEFAVPGCGACRISSRMSTFRGSLDGDDYDRDTFQASSGFMLPFGLDAEIVAAFLADCEKRGEHRL
jgi:hypothetical protein